MADHKDELITFLRRGNDLLDRLTETAAAQWQLAAPEMRILLFLDQHPEMDTARDVALQCGMSKASVSGNVLKLATRGLLTVDVDLRDRRFQHLTVTELARPILESSRSIFRKADAALMGALDEDESAQFMRLLKKINEAESFSMASEIRKDNV